MVTLPNGVDINNLIEDLRIYSWQAADILLNYSDKINDSNDKDEVFKSVDLNNPVTEADLKVNDIIIDNSKKNYSNINWDKIAKLMRKPSWIFDSRSILNRKEISRVGLNFWSIGNGLN